ncbi:unnamed protein product [Pleuronectes platessa]|uniref:Uncharacterized protein n=1 Tax=Pleuronectes platessa TaxID=8262 RepID=A0A9N7YWR1_PLEPL|nr:unnamed protein product [Pleuronectes platessa]
MKPGTTGTGRVDTAEAGGDGGFKDDVKLKCIKGDVSGAWPRTLECEAVFQVINWEHHILNAVSPRAVTSFCITLPFCCWSLQPLPRGLRGSQGEPARGPGYRTF